ncbi:tropomodulin-3-like [Oscarella lobularis]|uniref:tropomodulin-3-like n=1 Tax=Oscarella lobularis TaxID=121494 RepID=UPI003313FA1C
MDLDDIDAALADLTEDQLKELDDEMDPELLPARDRQRSSTTKEPTGEFDRARLRDFMTEEAKSSTVGADYIPFEKRTRGKVYKRPEKASSRAPRTTTTTTTDMDEIDRLLAGMSADDIGDLADAIDCDETDQVWTGLKRATKAPSRNRAGSGTRMVFSYTKDLQSHDVDPDEVIQRVADNDATLVEVNLNNHSRMDGEARRDLLSALPGNDHVVKLQLANIRFDDDDAKILAEHLESNRTIRVLNLESNRLTATGVRVLIKSLLKNQTVEEFRVENQYNLLGTRTEMEVAKYLEKNKGLLKLGLTVKGGGARQMIDKYLIRNNDEARRRRRTNSLKK